MATNKKGFMDAIKSDISAEAVPALGFLHKHAKIITISVLAIVVIILAAFGYQWYQNSRLNSQSAQLGSILATREGAARITALEEFLQKTPDKFKPAVYFEIAFTATSMEDYAKAAEAWKVGGDLLPNNDPMLAVAGLGLASSLNKSGKAAEGVAVLEDLLSKINADQSLTTFIKMELAALAEAAGQWGKSIAVYEEIAASEQGEGKNFFTFRAKELQARHPEAAQAPAQSDAAAPAKSSINATAESNAGGN